MVVDLCIRGRILTRASNIWFMISKVLSFILNWSAILWEVIFFYFEFFVIYVWAPIQYGSQTIQSYNFNRTKSTLLRKKLVQNFLLRQKWYVRVLESVHRKVWKKEDWRYCYTLLGFPLTEANFNLIFGLVLLLVERVMLSDVLRFTEKCHFTKTVCLRYPHFNASECR